MQTLTKIDQNIFRRLRTIKELVYLDNLRLLGSLSIDGVRLYHRNDLTQKSRIPLILFLLLRFGIIKQEQCISNYHQVALNNLKILNNEHVKTRKQSRA